MDSVRIESTGDIAVVKLQNGATNAVNPELVASLSAALKTVNKEYKGLVLAGGEKFFCIGLSLPELLPLNRNDMTEFWYQFNQLTHDLYSMPLPTVCAMAGHAPAVGTIWACACDYRIAADQKIRLGLNEIQLGIPTPFIVDLMLRQIVSDHIANDLLYSGCLISSPEAVELDLVNEVCAKEAVEERAVDKIREMTAVSSAAFAAIKTVRNQPLGLYFKENHKMRHQQFIDIWFSEHAQERLHAALKHF